MIDIRVQTARFDPGQLTAAAHGGDLAIGAVVCFTGYVRDFNQQKQVHSMFLEHFPGMTEKSLEKIALEARQRWPLQSIQILHRVGQLEQGEPIVFVATASAHREDAFNACAFVMDYLKTRAPFWKKEHTTDGSYWVDGRASDQAAAARWKQTGRSTHEHPL